MGYCHTSLQRWVPSVHCVSNCTLYLRIWYKCIDVANYVGANASWTMEFCAHTSDRVLQNANFFSDFAKCIFSLWVNGRPLFSLVWFLTRTPQLTSWFCESGSASFLLWMTPAHKGHTYPIKCHIACKTEKKILPNDADQFLNLSLFRSLVQYCGMYCPIWSWFWGDLCNILFDVMFYFVLFDLG